MLPNGIFIIDTASEKISFANKEFLDMIAQSPGISLLEKIKRFILKEEVSISDDALLDPEQILLKNVSLDSARSSTKKGGSGGGNTDSKTDLLREKLKQDKLNLWDYLVNMYKFNMLGKQAKTLTVFKHRDLKRFI
jgi:hypothetical protein